MLDHILLITCICITFGLILYFFYWNRFIGFVLGIFIRILYWNKTSSSIWVEIAGRILLRDIRYHSSNQTIKIVKGRIAWRYWVRRPAGEEDLGHSRRAGEDLKRPTRRLCRIQISFQGFEWFLYNRTAAYDNIISQMETALPSRTASRTTEYLQSFHRYSSRRDTVSPFHPSSLLATSIKTPAFIRKSVAWVRRQLPNLDPKDLFPVGIDINKGAIVCGNPSIPTLLVVEFQRAEGTFGIVQSRSQYDFYKQILSLQLQHASARLVQNDDYRESMIAVGTTIDGHIKESPKTSRSPQFSYHAFSKIWRQFKLYSTVFRKQPLPFGRNTRNHHIHRKSQKNPEEETPIGIDFSTFEYAKERKILEAPLLEISYYVDVVGTVPQHQPRVDSEAIDVGNGDVAPEWGIDIVIHGGFIRYGPWADRQRAELQRVFFPPTYHDVEQAVYLKPGSKRIWTSMQIFIELRDDTTLYMPFRESSKDWQWDGESRVPRPKKREPASIHLTAGDMSSISYSMPIVAGPTGFEPLIEVHLDSVAITSSLNDIPLVTAESCRIRAELPAPLKWNDKRKWSFAIILRLPVLYLIRDHINMFTDLAKDWTSGPLSDYHRFVPMLYTVELELHHYELNMYVNDHNIIDKPLIKDENALLTVRGRQLAVDVDIPTDHFRPESTQISFSVEAPDTSLNMSLPRWNTHALNVSGEGNSIAGARIFRVTGSYLYFSEVRKDNVEQLKITFFGQHVALKALGWSIRYFMVMRDNYFGSFTHFSTLYEYLDKRKMKQPLGDPIMLKYRKDKNNILQVEMEVIVEQGDIILPADLAGYETPSSRREKASEAGSGACVMLYFPELRLHFRMHDYYMEMSLSMDTISGSIENTCPETVAFRKPTAVESFFIDRIDITANRLFGPQPRTATYICIWEIQLGHVKAVLSAFDSIVLVAAGNAFRLNFADSLNAPAAEYLPPVDPDITFFKLFVSSIETIWRADKAALSFSVPQGLNVETNDLAGRFHRKLTSVRVPQVSVKVLLTKTTKPGLWLEAAELSFDLFVDIYSSPREWRDSARAQAEFIAAQDYLTERGHRMLSSLKANNSVVSGRGHHENGLYLPQPMLSSRGLPLVHKTARKAMLNATLRPKTSLSRRHSSKLYHMSESEGEEGVSEADRDARLAQSRSQTFSPAFIVDDEFQNMTSGDESDNEDLTNSSESDWSEHTFDYSVGLLHRYSRFTAWYISRRLDTPSQWSGSPFIETKAHLFDFPTAHDGTEYQDLNVTPRQIRIDYPSNENDSTVVRVECHKRLQVTITPLVVPAANFFKEELVNNIPGPELCIDIMMAKYLGGFRSSSNPARSMVTLLDVHLTFIHVRLLQDITLNPQMNIERVDPVALVDLCLDNCHVSSSSATPENHNLAAIFGKTTLSSSTVPISRASSHDQNHNSTSFIWTGFKAGYVEGKLDVNLGKIEIELGHSGPEYLAATVISLLKGVRDLAAIQSAWMAHSHTMTKALLHNILTYSNDKVIVDPLSTIQPSYLVQSGRPHYLRTDAIFKFLFHLRSCMWHLDATERRDLYSMPITPSSVDIEAVTSLLKSRLDSLALDVDTPDVDDLPSLVLVFLGLAPKIGKPRSLSRPPLDGAALQFDTFSIRVLDPSRAPPGELSLSSVTITTQARKFDLNPFSILHPGTFSQTSFKEISSQTVKRTAISVVIGDINLTILPHLLLFAQHLLRVNRYYGARLSGKNPANLEAAVASPGKRLDATSTEVTIHLNNLSIQAAAENLVFEVGTSGSRAVSTVYSRHHGAVDCAMNHALLFNSVFLRARSTSETRGNDQNILAALVFTGGKISAVARRDPSASVTVRPVYSLDNVVLSIPRSAIRLYRFVEEWRADFFPGIEATWKALLSEMQDTSKPTFSPTPSNLNASPMVDVHGQIIHAGVSLQVMHGTWLSWEANRTVAYLKSSSSTHSFGLQMASQVYSVSSRPDPSPDTVSNTRVKLMLPALSFTGNIDDSGIHALGLVEFFHVKVKPSHWDTLLAVQQKFGQDFNDLIALIQETRLKQSSSVAKDRVSPSLPWRYVVFLKMRGFRLSLEGLSSTVFLECEDIGSGVNNDAGLKWYIKLSDLALSLAPQTASKVSHSAFSRTLRSAFVIIDLNASGERKAADESTNNTMHIAVTKIHAVMQPSSIGQVGDFIDHLQAETLDRKEQRAQELAAFKEKTRSILRSFEVKVEDSTLEEETSWLSQHVIKLSIENIGVAFPLTLDQDLQLPQTGSQDSSAVPAFIISIRSLVFDTQRETGHAIMKRFSFQFVSQFRQSVPADFSGETHYTRNRLVYPEMKAQLRSDRTGGSRKIWIGANVSGFILDLDATIPDYIFSLVDVYRSGKDRVTQLAATSNPHTPTSNERATGVSKHQPNTVPIPNILASLTILSGRVRVYGSSYPSLFRSKSSSHVIFEPSEDQTLEFGAEVFQVPVVSVWAEYRPALPSRKPGYPVPSILMFKSTIHSSENTLRPTLLPFITELVNHVETRMRKASRPNSLPIHRLQPVLPTPTTEPGSSLQISFSLRIDQSKLEMTCQPDVNVVAGLHWDSGGFIINVFPGARQVTLTGSVGGLTAGLKHGFLSEDCVRLDARNLAFSVAFSRMGTEADNLLSSISFVMDTEFSGAARFSRLQDVLCFKAVWLDRIPVFAGQSPTESKEPLKSTFQPILTPTPTKNGVATAVLIRIRHIILDVDLGQSISALTLDLKSALMRTRLSESGSSEVSLSVADVAITAKGNVSGFVNVPNCVFRTIRRSEGDNLNDAGKNKMLELSMTSGALVAMLESDHQKLLHYRAEPLEVEVFDDWSMTSPQVHMEERPLRLSFTVTGSEIIAVVTVGTVPKILSYVNKFKANLASQREGASRESSAFRSTRSPKPDNPLSAVANAMLLSARDRFKEADNGLSYVIRQSMSLELDLLHLVVFPRTMSDMEMAQFIGRNVRAQLDRLVGSETVTAKRELHLSFSSMTISKFGQLNHPLAVEVSPSNGAAWLKALYKDAAEAIIVGLPSMNMYMDSEESIQDLSRILEYNFHSRFVRREGMKDFEDIYITLNVSLYSWLTLLRKNLAREMDQVQATADWRMSLTVPHNISSLRQKAPKPLQLVDGPRSATLPQPFDTPSKIAVLEQSKSTTSTQIPPDSTLSEMDLLSPTFTADPSPVLTGGSSPAGVTGNKGITYVAKDRHIERLTMRQLGEATPDVMHPFFMKKAGFNLEDALPQYVNEYATAPLEEIMEVLLKLYSRQLPTASSSNDK